MGGARSSGIPLVYHQAKLEATLDHLDPLDCLPIPGPTFGRPFVRTTMNLKDHFLSFRFSDQQEAPEVLADHARWLPGTGRGAGELVGLARERRLKCRHQREGAHQAENSAERGAGQRCCCLGAA